MTPHRFRSSVAVWLFAIPTGTFAGSFSVSPVRVSLEPDRSSASLTVRNDSKESTVVQLRTVSWTQANGKEQQEATRDLVATPAIFTLLPGATQTVRVGMINVTPDARTERSYRLLMTEVPQEVATDFKGIRVAIQLSVPVFIPSIATSVPVLRWEANAVMNGLRLVAHNEGNVHVQVKQIGIGSSPEPLKASPGYVLAGQWREWTLSNEARVGSPIDLTVETDAGPMPARVVVSDH